MLQQVLKDIQNDDEVASFIRDVKDIIFDTLKNSLPEVEEYVISTFGKHIRSTVLYLSVKALSSHAIVPPTIGAAFELIHTATLMHDDVLDEADIRRGKKSFRAKYGAKFSILAGDLLIGITVNLIWRTKSWRLVKLYAELGQNLVVGEVNGARLSISDNTSKYYSQIYLKTGCFFEIICKMAATITGCRKAYADAITEYGEIFGRRFQIRDDFIDYFMPTSFSDKKQGGDFFNNMVTLPLIYAYRQGDCIEKQLIMSALANPTPESFKVIKRLMKKLNIDNMLLNEMKDLSLQANSILSPIKDSKYKEYLSKLALV